MRSLPAQRSYNRSFHRGNFLLPIVFLFLLPVAVCAQGGKSSIGNGGTHTITGFVFFPSGRRAEGNIQIKLTSYNAGELSVMADNSGAFTFSSLSPGSYTVVVNAGDEYEVAREGVFIDTDIDTSRTGIPTIKISRRYTVMITLQLKAVYRSKASVVNAALAEVPENARKLYEKGLEWARAGDSLKAIDNLRAAVSLYPKFPLALNELGVQYLKLGQPVKALEPLKSASKLSPDATTPKLNLGIALLETRQFADAETQLRDVLRVNPSVPTAHMYLGVAIAGLHNYPEAEKELRRSIELSGNQMGKAHYYLGGLYWQIGDRPRAIDELETYLRLTPNAQDAEKVRGTIKQLRGNKSRLDFISRNPSPLNQSAKHFDW